MDSCLRRNDTFRMPVPAVIPACWAGIHRGEECQPLRLAGSDDFSASHYIHIYTRTEIDGGDLGRGTMDSMRQTASSCD